MKKVFIFLLLATVIFTAGGFVSQANAAPSLNYTSCFQVQNLDSVNNATIVIEYYQQGSSTPVASPSDTVNAGSSNTYCPLSAVSSGFNGSVIINSDVPVSAIANVSGSDGGTPNFSTYNASYSGFSSGGTTVNLPLLFDNNYGFDTWFNVQNTGSTDASVTVNYSDGTSVGPVTIGAGQSHTFDQASETHNQAVFAATITSTQPIVATVLEVGPSTAPLLFGYNGFTSGAPDIVMPLVQANNFGYGTGIQIQNTGSSATTVTVTYTPASAGTACTETKSIAAGSSETFALSAWDNNDANTDNNCVNGETFVGSAQVTGNTASMDLVGIVNQQNFSTNKGASYSAFNPSSATNTVVMPLIMDRNYGYFTGFNVANVGTSTVTVNCTFSGSSVTTSASLAPGEALNHVQLNAISDSYVGSATCSTTGGKLVAVVNQLLNSGSADTLLTYEAASTTTP